MISIRVLEDSYYIVGIATPICAVLYGLGRWVLKQRDDIKELKNDMSALKTNHLPHIYYMLKLIADHLNIHEGDGL